MPTILSRLRGLAAPTTPDQPLRLADAGGVVPSTGGSGQTILIARNMRDVRRQTVRYAGHLNPSGVTPGTYLLASIAVNAEGRVTAASSGSGGGGGVLNVTPDTHPLVPTANDDEFEFGTSIDTSGARFAGATGWSAFNATGYSTAIAQGSLVLTSASSGTSLLGGYSQPIVGSTWSYTAKVSMRGLASATTVSGGLFVAVSGTSSKIANLVMTSSAGNGIVVQHLTNVTTLSANALTTGTIPVTGGAWITFYLQISYDGTNLHYSISSSGVAGSFVPVFSELPATFLGSVPTVVGITEGSQTASSVIFDWFRKTL